MSSALRMPPLPMTREQFLDWAERQEGTLWEFDGVRPVRRHGPEAMTGGRLNHAQIAVNIVITLHHRLRGGPCRAFNSDAGVGLPGGGVRYPDASVTCTRSPSMDRLLTGVLVVFEVLSPNSGRTDRILKVRDYHTVPTIRRYVIAESTTAAVTVLERDNPEEAWRSTPLTRDETLRMPEIGIEVPVAEFYEGVDLPDDEDSYPPLNPVATT